MEANPSVPREKVYRPMWVILFAAAAMVAIVGLSKISEKSELIPWRADLSAAMDQARAEEKSVLLYFTADWCGPCQQMKRTTWSDGAVAQAMGNYVPVRIDVDRDSATAAQFGVQTIPTIAVLSPDRQFTKATVGGMDPQSFLAWLRS